MKGCLFTLLLGGVAIALIVVIGLPQVAAGALTTAVSAGGLEADDTTVTVSSDPPTDLLGLKADRVRIRATDATFRGLQIGALDLELGDVAILDRTADTVDGRLTEVRIENIGGREVTLDAITIAGGGDDITATTTFPGRDVERLLADVAEAQLGTRPKAVALSSPNRVLIDVGFDVEGTLEVTEDGDLVLIVRDGPLVNDEVVLLRGGEDLPIRLTGVRVTGDGDLRLAGDLEIGILG
jgi:hypothetical protein